MNATRSAPAATRRRSSGRSASVRPTAATTSVGERMTIAERRAHTMKAIKMASASAQSSPASPTVRASPRSAAPTRRVSASPRAPVEPARVQPQAPTVDEPEAPVLDLVSATDEPQAPVLDRAPTIDEPQAPAPDLAQSAADADKVSRLEEMVSALQQQVEKLTEAQAASKCDCRHQLSVVADSIMTLENTVFSVHDKLLRLEAHVLTNMQCWEDRVKAQVVAFHTDMQALSDSFAALKNNLDTTTDRMPRSPFKLRKQGQPCRVRVFGAQDSFRSSSYTSVASGSSYSNGSSLYSSAGSSTTSVASSSFVIAKQDSAVVVDTSDVFERSHASMTGMARPATEFFLSRDFSTNEAHQEDDEACRSAVRDASDASITDSQSSSDDADMGPMLCISDLC